MTLPSSFGDSCSFSDFLLVVFFQRDHFVHLVGVGYAWDNEIAFQGRNALSWTMSWVFDILEFSTKHFWTCFWAYLSLFSECVHPVAHCTPSMCTHKGGSGGGQLSLNLGSSIWEKGLSQFWLLEQILGCGAFKTNKQTNKLISYHFGSWKLKLKMPAWLGSDEGHLARLQMALYLYCLSYLSIIFSYTDLHYGLTLMT